MSLGENFDGALAAARAGEGWAWEAVYRDLAPVVTGYLRAQGAPEPDDLTAEVFLQVVRDLGGFEGREREFRSWVFTIAHHRLLDQRRRLARRPVDLVPATSLGEARVGGDVEEEALESIGDERVRRLLAGLSTDQRSVLLLRIVGDLTVEQVAAVTGRRPGAVKALQRRGLAALKRALKGSAVTL